MANDEVSSSVHEAISAAAGLENAAKAIEATPGNEGKGVELRQQSAQIQHQLNAVPERPIQPIQAELSQKKTKG